MLTQKAKYAIKALVCLAQNDGLVKTKDIAEKARIPRKFLESILLELKSHQLVASVQGPAGGYYLLKNAGEITLAAVYRIFEGPIALVPCASLNFYQPCQDCLDEKSCPIRKAMIDVRDQMLVALQEISIGKIAAENG